MTNLRRRNSVGAMTHRDGVAPNIRDLQSSAQADGGPAPGRVDVAPTVAVVVPIHRASPAFTRCVEALARFDPAPAELIVVVDGGDAAVAAQAAAASARVVLLEPRCGPAVARNVGAARASSDVLLFLDGDVVAPPGIVAQVASVFAADRGLSAVIGSYDDHPDTPGLTARYANLRHHFVHQRAKEVGWTFWGACGAIRRTAFEEVGGFDEDYATPSIEDIEFGYRLRDAGLRIRVVKDLQITHLKRWTPVSLLKTDLLHRALPWSALILRTRRVDDDLNVSLAERGKAALMVLAAALVAVSPRWPGALVAVAVAAACVLALDGPLLALLARRGGLRLAAWGAAWHLGYHLYAALGFAAALLRHAVFGAQPVQDPWPGSPRRSMADAARTGAAVPAGAPAFEVATIDHRNRRASSAVRSDRLLSQSRRLRRGVPPAVLVAAGLALLPLFRNAVHVDGLAYVRVAGYYADGRWDLAVNSYWGPLYSWLLAPLLAVGVEPLLATKLLQLALGAATVVALRRLCLRCGIRTATADGVALVTVPLVLHLAFRNVYADLLLALLLLLFCAEVVPGDGRVPGDGSPPTGGPGPPSAVRAGLWGGLAVLAKPYALPVVVVSVAVIALVLWWRAPAARRATARAAALTLATFAVVVVPWVAIISAKEGELTASRTIGYNLAVVSPGSAGQPLANGLVRPSHPEALFAWEDPGRMPLESDGWSVSDDAARRLGANLVGNVGTGLGLVASQFAAVPAFAVAGAAVIVHGRRRRVRPAVDSPWWALAVVTTVYTGGYLFTLVEGRYLWFAVLALAPLAAVALDAPILRSGLRPTAPGYALWRLAGFALLAGLVAVQAVVALRGRTDGDEVARVADRLAAAHPDLAGRMQGAEVASAGDWEASAVLCFHLGCTYLGAADPTGVDLTDVDFYLVWDGQDGDGGAAGGDELGPPAATVGALAVHAVP